MGRLEGKVAIVTGAGSGIGAAITTSLIDNGLKVVGLDIVRERLDALAANLLRRHPSSQFHPIETDVRVEEQVVTAFKWTAEHVGPVSVLVNSAGLAVPTDTLCDGRTDAWRTVLDTNVLGLSVATREAVRQMRAHHIVDTADGGHIVHINSMAGHFVPNIPQLNMYPASKHAVTALAETLRHECRRLNLNIKITSISPGAVRTPANPGVLTAGVLEDIFADIIRNMSYLNAEDIAEAVVYVLSTPPHVQIDELTITSIAKNQPE